MLQHKSGSRPVIYFKVYLLFELFSPIYLPLAARESKRIVESKFCSPTFAFLQTYEDSVRLQT